MGFCPDFPQIKTFVGPIAPPAPPPPTPVRSTGLVVISQCISALHSPTQYPPSNIDSRWMNLTSLGGELAEYSQEQPFWALRFLSAVLRASFLKFKTYCRVRKGKIGCAGLA